MLSSKAWHDAVSPALGQVLLPAGFEEVRPHRWVRSDDAPIRAMVEVLTTKGAGMALRWGFSLDYVPHVEGNRRVRWHRTPKSARLDLIWDPVDWGGTRFRMSQDFFAEEAAAASDVARQAVRVAAAVSEEVLPQLSGATRVTDLPELFEQWLRRPAERFGFWNYVQAPLAYAFTWATLGEGTEARDWLSRTFERQSELSVAVRSELERRLERTLAASV